ncbi:Phage T7 capsid assembly protein [Chelatococcus sambhunathii]|uniref:Phage T7 capsid assembly protein n=1 Tax=Chelatococcus sambhunathii TaxID=363953 RepID=A0ABM9U9U1_9HYPH|nr:hypothetical protein [Chelatococcus sambhunathii]CUA91001.1 Phage T7 capsid assembly protein [Chelatococcus sambhunathii]
MTASISVPAAEAPAERPVETTPTNPALVAAPSQDQPGARPENVPEKFWDAEKGAVRTDALLASYMALETRLGGQQQPDQPPAVTPAQEAHVEQTLAANGLDIASFNEEYTKTGALSQESYEKLAKAGLSREFVDEYIRGQEAIAQQDINAVYAEVGGEAEFRKIQTWAASNLPRPVLEAFNKTVESGGREALTLAIAGLQARYVAANGREPNLVNGTPSGSVEGFRSKHEIIQAMSDPRYRKDEAYRADVTARLAVTPF